MCVCIPAFLLVNLVQGCGANQYMAQFHKNDLQYGIPLPLHCNDFQAV